MRKLPPGDWLEQDSVVCCPDPRGGAVDEDHPGRDRDDEDLGPHVSGDAQFGVGFGGTLPPGEYPALAVRLEQFGFDVATVFGDLMMQPPAMALASMAPATSRIQLGVGCYTPWTLHPVEIAGRLRLSRSVVGRTGVHGHRAGRVARPAQPGHLEVPRGGDRIPWRSSDYCCPARRRGTRATSTVSRQAPRPSIPFCARRSR